MTIEHQKNHLKTVVRKLVKLDVFRIQRLEQAKPISDKMHSFCCSIFDLYSYDVSIVDEIYQQERDYFNIVNDFDGIEISKCENLNLCLDIIKAFTDINDGTVYYLCQRVKNDKYPMYEVEDIGWRVIHDFCDLMGIPKFVIHDLAKSDSRENRSDVWRLIFNNPNYPWYIDNDVEYCKEYNKKEDKIKSKTKFLENLITPNKSNNVMSSDDFFASLGEKHQERRKERNSFTSRQAENNKQISYLINEELDRYSVFNRNENEFVGLTHSGFSALLSSERKLKDYTLKAISKDISENISNDKIKTILEMFPELGLNGSLFETKPFYKVYSPNKYKQEDGTITTEPLFRGNPIIKYATIAMCPYATWNHEYNGMLGKLFHYLKIDLDLLSFSESGTPIIQL